jgi:HK97 family phage major capsid protein
MRQAELIRRADLALSDLANDGGLLQPQQSNRFMRKIIDSPTIIRDARTIPMRGPSMEINKIGFGQRVLRAARNSSTQRSGPYAVGQRALLEAERAKPQTSKIELNTSEIIAEINLPYETLEDNIEGSNMRNTILALLADRVALDLEELIVLGDTDIVNDPYLALQDGVLTLAESNVVNHGGAPVDVDLFKNMAKALPTQYLPYLGDYRTYVAPYREIDYRATVAQRQTALGDAIISGRTAPTIMGVPLVKAAKMPQDQALLTIPNNIIVGVQRDMRLEYDTDIRERVFIIVLTMRVAVAIEEADMVVKAVNIGDE